MHLAAKLKLQSTANYRSPATRIYPPCGKNVAIQSERFPESHQGTPGPMSVPILVCQYLSK
jgi:hypothetical protein